MQNSMNVTQPLLGDFSLSDENADPTNWEWEAEYKALWKPAAGPWRKFRNMWYGGTAPLVNPESPSLSLEPFNRQLDSSLSSSLFIRRSYLTMFNTVWERAMAKRGQNGVIITGQPGTGKTLFNYYLLVRLLQLRQVVLYSQDGQNLYLFYHDGVYTPGTQVSIGSLKSSLPLPRSSSDGFIWSLFDIRQRQEPESVMVDYPCFPVQTTSPDPIRYRTWQKELSPLRTGLPLWTRDELAQGLRYQRNYQRLLDALNKFYASSSPTSEDPLWGFDGPRALLEERYGGDDTPAPSPEEALDYLLDAAIDRFGYSARDVFRAVFSYTWMTQHHEKAFRLKYSELQGTASALFKNTNATDTLSDCLLALSPIDEQPLVGVRWEVDFKSDWVAKNVIRKLGEAEDDVIRQQINHFKFLCFPDARGLARRLLEPLVHRHIANTSHGFWSLGSMNSNDADPPHFTLVTDSPVPGGVRFLQVKRKIVELQSTASLSSCLENNSYYIPADPNFPMFDAFTVDLDRAEKSAILWVIQVTSSRTHGGSSSSLGYQKIREIVAILKNELLGAQDPPLKKTKALNGQAATLPLTPSVEVRYLLVVPKLKDESEIQSKDLQWEFPKGWSQNRNKHDHCGNVYCLKVSL